MWKYGFWVVFYSDFIQIYWNRIILYWRERHRNPLVTDTDTVKQEIIINMTWVCGVNS